MSVKCNLDAKKYDLLTITAADYAVSLNITNKMNLNFNKTQQVFIEKYASIGEAWIKYLTTKIETIL